MKQAVFTLSLTTYDAAGALLCEEVKAEKVELQFTKQLHVESEVATGSPEVIDLTTIASPKAFILFNRGTADIAYKASGKLTDSGIISPGGFICIAAAGFDAIEVTTGNLTAVPFEYWQLG